MIELETDTMAQATSTTDTNPTPPPTGPTTTSMTSTSPPDTGPLDTSPTEVDTGPLDTGELWMDLPEDCSLYEQDCPPGYKCTPYSNDGGGAWNDYHCVPVVPDPNLPGEPCTFRGDPLSGYDDCDQTSMCWDVDLKTLIGKCVPYCIGTVENPTCSNPCDVCSISGSGIVDLCFTGCDPLVQPCDDGEGCYPVQESFVCAPDASAVDADIGSPCRYINVCPPGLVCINANDMPECEMSGGCCTAVCPVDGADPCPGLLPGTVCRPWYEGRPPIDESCFTAEIGVCALPE